MKAYFSCYSILTPVGLLVFFPASPSLRERKTKGTKQKLQCHLFGRNEVWEVVRLSLLYLRSIWLKNENTLFKPKPFWCWMKGVVFCRREVSTDFASFLKSWGEQSFFQSFLPPAKVLSDQCCGTIAVMYFFNGAQKKTHILLGSSFLWAVSVISTEYSPSSSP